MLGAQIKESLTVLQVLPALEGGGVERGTLDVAAELVRRGQRSLVMSARGRLLPELIASGSEHISCPLGHKSPTSLRYVWQLRRLLATAGIDIVHARSRLPAWLAWLAWRSLDASTRPRFMTTVHGLYSVNRYSAVMMQGERVIAVSGVVRSYILDNYPGVDAARIHVIPRGVDTERYSKTFVPRDAWLADWYRRYPQLQDRFVITLPGRVGARKGVLEFIQVIARLRQAGHDVHGLVVGERARHDNKLARRMDAAISEAGVADAITCTGFREDVREIMAVSDAVVSMSRKPEAYGRTVNEALGLGIPVAGYDHGGVGEQLAAHFPAGRVPPDQLGVMADRLAGWIEVPPSMDAVQPHPLDAMLDSTLQLYRELAESPRQIPV